MAVEPFLGTRAQKLFIASVTLQAIVVLVMVGITFHKVDDHVTFNTQQYKTLPCYLALFALAEIFEILMAFDALRLRNIIQLIGILLFHAALIVMAALQVHQTHTALVSLGGCPASVDFVKCDGPGTLWRQIEPYLIVAPCVLAGSLLILMFWIKELYAEFGWAIFHVVGANPKMKTMYQYYQVEVCLLKFDFFFFVGVTIQLIIIVLNHNSAEFGVTIAAIPVVLTLLAFCSIALAREVKWLMSVSLVLMLAAMSYFVYKLVRYFQPFINNLPNPYVSTRASLTIFTIVALILLFATFAIGLRCFSDFDKGLKDSKTDDITAKTQYLPGLPSPGKGNMSERQSSYMGGAPATPRISIE